MDKPNIEVIRHWVAWGPSEECPDGYMEHSFERVEQFEAWLADVKDAAFAKGVLAYIEYERLRDA